MRAFAPRADVLSPARRRLWPALRNAPAPGLTLSGGLAIALRLKHRHSVDSDFFAEHPLDRAAIRAAFTFIAASTTLQDHGNAWSLMTPVDSAPADGAAGRQKKQRVKISFFGAIHFRRVGAAGLTDDGIMQIASLDDLMATRRMVVAQCAEARDYRDVAAMIEAGVSIPRRQASARPLFGPNFRPGEGPKAPGHFGDGDLKVSPTAGKTTRLTAVRFLWDLPDVALRSQSLANPPDDSSVGNRT